MNLPLRHAEIYGYRDFILGYTLYDSLTTSGVFVTNYT